MLHFPIRELLDALVLRRDLLYGCTKASTFNNTLSTCSNEWERFFSSSGRYGVWAWSRRTPYGGETTHTRGHTFLCLCLPGLGTPHACSQRSICTSVHTKLLQINSSFHLCANRFYPSPAYTTSIVEGLLKISQRSCVRPHGLHGNTKQI